MLSKDLYRKYSLWTTFMLLFVFFAAWNPMMTHHLHGIEKSGVNILLNVSFSISSKSYLEQHKGEVNENRNYSYKLLIYCIYNQKEEWTWNTDFRWISLFI